MRSWPHAQDYVGALFNVPNRGPIPGTSLVTILAGDWGVKLRGSYVSTISQPQFRFDRLSSPARAKCFFYFFLP